MSDTQWDRFAENQKGRIMETLGFTNTLEVYEPSESKNSDGGIDVSYPSSPTDTIDAEITTPEAVGERDAGGTESNADVIIRVPDDTGLSFVGYGQSEQGTAEVVDVESGDRYAVQTIVDEHNGLLELEAVSV